jgi:hypothetical protein
MNIISPDYQRMEMSLFRISFASREDRERPSHRTTSHSAFWIHHKIEVVASSCGFYTPPTVINGQGEAVHRPSGVPACDRHHHDATTDRQPTPCHCFAPLFANVCVLQFLPSPFLAQAE